MGVGGIIVVCRDGRIPLSAPLGPKKGSAMVRLRFWGRGMRNAMMAAVCTGCKIFRLLSFGLSFV